MFFTFYQFQCFALYYLILDHWTKTSSTFAAFWLKLVLVILPFSDSYYFRVRNCVSYSDRVENNYAFFLFISVVCEYALSILRFRLCGAVLFALKVCSCSNFSVWCYCLVVQECYIAYTSLNFLKRILVIIDLSYLPSPLIVWLDSGTRIKTRKRNITIPLDPASFSDAVVQIYLDNAGDLVIVAPSFMIAKIFFCINMLLIDNFICLSMIFLYRNSLPGTLSLQNLTSQDTGIPSLRYSFWWCYMLTHFQYWIQYCLMWTSFLGS